MSWQDEAIELRKSGKSIRATASELGVAYSTLWDFLHGCAPQPPVDSFEYLPDVQVKPGVSKELIFKQVITSEDYNNLVSSGVCWEIAAWMPDTYKKYKEIRDEYLNGAS